MTTASFDAGDAERLRAERDDLRAQLDAIRGRRPPRRRTVAAVSLVVLASLAFVAAVPGIWARRNFLDTDRFVDRAAPLVEDPAVQEVLTVRITGAVMQLVDPRALLEEVVPERGALLVVPLTNAIEGFVGDRVAGFVASDRFAELWADAVRVAHATAADAIRGRGDVVTVADGEVQLNLLPVVGAVLQRVGEASPEILGREVDLPEITVDDVPDEVIARLERALDVDLGDGFGAITVYDEGDLAPAQDAVAAFDEYVVWLLPLAVVLAGLAVWVSGRRRSTLLQLVVGVVVGMVVLRRVAFRVHDEVVAAPPTEAGREALGAVADAFLDPLTTFAAWAIGVAAAAGLIAFVTGPYASAVALRHRVRSLWVAATGAAKSQARDDKAVVWMRAHRSPLLIGGAVVGLALLWAADLSWLGLAVVVAIVVAFEVTVQRMTASP